MTSGAMRVSTRCTDECRESECYNLTHICADNGLEQCIGSTFGRIKIARCFGLLNSVLQKQEEMAAE